MINTIVSDIVAVLPTAPLLIQGDDSFFNEEHDDVSLFPVLAWNQYYEVAVDMIKGGQMNDSARLNILFLDHQGVDREFDMLPADAEVIIERMRTLAKQFHYTIMRHTNVGPWIGTGVPPRCTITSLGHKFDQDLFGVLYQSTIPFGDGFDYSLVCNLQP